MNFREKRNFVSNQTTHSSWHDRNSVCKEMRDKKQQSFESANKSKIINK